MNTLLSTGDLAEATELSLRILSHAFIEKGHLKPVFHANGKGNHLRFLPIQAIAVAFAKRWRDFGAGPRLVAEICQHVASMGISHIEEDFSQGRIYLWDVRHGELSKASGGNNRLDTGLFNLKSAYDGVLAKIELIQAREKERPRQSGRPRGLICR